MQKDHIHERVWGFFYPTKLQCFTIQKKESRILFSSPNTSVQRFDKVLLGFIFIILAPHYSLSPPPPQFLWEQRNRVAGMECKPWALSYKCWGAGEQFQPGQGFPECCDSSHKAARTGPGTRGDTVAVPGGCAWSLKLCTRVMKLR